MITLDNLHDGDTVHQRCLLIIGRCEGASSDDSYIEIAANDKLERPTFPAQHFPMCRGLFKALAMLVPGDNVLRLSSGKNSSQVLEICVRYVPLLQTPPLHLAIMVAKDSPLLIDCPPRKFGAISGAHSSLDAAISKLRVTAYMWQALTAEEMRSNDLGRRSFRLEEEWAADTLSQEFANESTMQSTAKVHLIRTDKSVADLRDAQLAQQNPTASQKNALHEIFTEALLAHGAPFTQEARPVVAGMILDSHYDAEARLIVAHAALGAHNPNGLSLGMFGSHLTYSWPRFIEEVSDCLLDTASPGDRVGNDNGECVSMWETCSVGQGAFLHEVGHAFSAPHTTGIMSRGYSKDWPKNFLSKTAFCVSTQTEGIRPVEEATASDCHWDLRDLLRFCNLSHFRLPSDQSLSYDLPKVELQDDEDFLRVIITSETGIARALLNGNVEPGPSQTSPVKMIQYTQDELESRFDSGKPLELEIIAMNGKERVLDLWTFLSTKKYIRVLGGAVRLMKQGVACAIAQSDDCHWIVMLKRRSKNGSIVSATKIDIRVGCSLDGAVVYYSDGTNTPCGPGKNSREHHNMGGHQARRIAIPKGVEIAKVALSKRGEYDLAGLRVVLSNGKAMGALNGQGGEVEVLVPENGQKVVGFYGTSGAYGMCNEFGIITASASQQLPDSVYDQPELQHSPTNRSERGINRGRDSNTEDDKSDTSEDEDEGYDHDSDLDMI